MALFFKDSFSENIFPILFEFNEVRNWKVSMNYSSPKISSLFLIVDNVAHYSIGFFKFDQSLKIQAFIDLFDDMGKSNTDLFHSEILSR